LVVTKTKTIAKKQHGGPRPGGGRSLQRGIKEQLIIEKARKQGRSFLTKVVKIWGEGLDHTPDDCDQERHDCKGHVLRCCTEIAQRFGLPAMQNIQAEVVQNEKHELVLTWRGTSKLPQGIQPKEITEVASNGNKSNGKKSLPRGDNKPKG
jgi:hypothetical protein